MCPQRSLAAVGSRQMMQMQSAASSSLGGVGEGRLQVRGRGRVWVPSAGEGRVGGCRLQVRGRGRVWVPSACSRVGCGLGLGRPQVRVGVGLGLGRLNGVGDAALG